MLALGPFQPPIKWEPGELSTGIELSERETGHSSLSSAEVRNCGVVLPLPHKSPWRCAYKIKHTENFTFILLLLSLLLCEAGYVCQYTEWVSAGGRVSIPCNGRNCFRCVHTAVENESEERVICWQRLNVHSACCHHRQMNSHVRFT